MACALLELGPASRRCVGNNSGEVLVVTLSFCCLISCWSVGCRFFFSNNGYWVELVLSKHSPYGRSGEWHFFLSVLKWVCSVWTFFFFGFSVGFCNGGLTSFKLQILRRVAVNFSVWISIHGRICFWVDFFMFMDLILYCV